MTRERKMAAAWIARRIASFRDPDLHNERYLFPQPVRAGNPLLSVNYRPQENRITNVGTVAARLHGGRK
jgi:hypothetical protein